MDKAINVEDTNIKKNFNKLIKNNSLFNKYDEILVNRQFSYVKDLSDAENILNIKTYTLTPRDIKNAIEKFITHKKIIKTDTHNILQISNLAKFRIEHNLNDDVLLEIGKKAANVSHETTSLCVDFKMLKILDNFIQLTNNANIKNNFNSIRKDVLRKIMRFDYKKIKEERRVNYFYWLNRILEAFIKEDITVYEFIGLNKKMVLLMPDFIDLYWEIIRIVNCLCFHPKYCCSFSLRKFKRDMLKLVKTKYNPINIDKNNVLDVLFNTLSYQQVSKESFYYLFDLINILSEKSCEDKIFCFTLMEYLIHRDQYQNVFCFRFVRETFLKMLENIIKKDDDFNIKERELCFMFILSENENFCYLYNDRILNNINFLINTIQQQNKDSTDKKIFKYYKYMDILKNEMIYNKKLVTFHNIFI